MLHYILGITKAYCTRVGGGPFPTELDWEKEGTPGYHMSIVGAEKGTTTGRSRRCGWFDAALLKRSAQVNGLTGLCITKLDVLDGLTELLLCVGYELDGEKIDILPMGADEIAQHRGRDRLQQAAQSRSTLPEPHCRNHWRADSHGVDQPRP
jgi:adenylosuccinate synthase